MEGGVIGLILSMMILMYILSNYNQLYFYTIVRGQTKEGFKEMVQCLTGKTPWLEKRHGCWCKNYDLMPDTNHP